MKLRHLFAVLVIALTGCGFHLRGFALIPPWLTKVAVVVQNGHRELGSMLKEQLLAYHIEVVNNPADANYLLIIESDDVHQQLTNVGASTAPRQYLLIYDASFSLVKNKGAPVISSAHVFVNRQLTVNNDRILGSNAEERLLINEMRRDVIIQMINRISRENRSLDMNSYPTNQTLGVGK